MSLLAEQNSYNPSGGFPILKAAQKTNMMTGLLGLLLNSIQDLSFVLRWFLDRSFSCTEFLLPLLGSQIENVPKAEYEDRTSGADNEYIT